MPAATPEEQRDLHQSDQHRQFDERADDRRERHTRADPEDGDGDGQFELLLAAVEALVVVLA